jgi:hypothetical protein
LTTGQNYTITATATDSSSQTGNALPIIVTVDNSFNPNDIYVGDMSWASAKRGPWTDLIATILVKQDTAADGFADGNAANVSVLFQMINAGADGVFGTGDDSAWLGSGTTNANGIVPFKLKNAPAGNYQGTVLSLTHATLTWNSALDVDNPSYFTLSAAGLSLTESLVYTLAVGGFRMEVPLEDFQEAATAGIALQQDAIVVPGSAAAAPPLLARPTNSGAQTAPGFAPVLLGATSEEPGKLPAVAGSFCYGTDEQAAALDAVLQADFVAPANGDLLLIDPAAKPDRTPPAIGPAAPALLFPSQPAGDTSIIECREATKAAADAVPRLSGKDNEACLLAALSLFLMAPVHQTSGPAQGQEPRRRRRPPC